MPGQKVRAKVFTPFIAGRERKVAAPFAQEAWDGSGLTLLRAAGTSLATRRPIAADDGLGLRHAGRRFLLVLKVRVEPPITCGFVVVSAGSDPKIRRVDAGEHHDNRAVVGQGGTVIPVFQQPQEIFQTAAVMLDAGDVGGYDDAFEARGIDGRVAAGS